MLHPKLSREEIAQRGKGIYEDRIRTQVETANNIGKIVSIDVETGEYEIGDDLVVTPSSIASQTSGCSNLDGKNRL